MNLKKYQRPSAICSNTASLQLMTLSGGGTQPGDPIINPNPDDGDEDPRTKGRNQNFWGNLW